MEAVDFSESSVNLHHVTWCHIPNMLTFMLRYAVLLGTNNSFRISQYDTLCQEVVSHNLNFSDQ
jgi:hypothetical protein